MLLNSTLYYILILPLSVVISLALSLALKRLLFNLFTSMLKLNTVVRTFGVLVFVVVLVYLLIIANNLLVINENINMKKYVFIGKTELYIDGINYSLEKVDYKDVFIINKTGSLLVFETYDYGNPIVPIMKFDFIYGVEPDSMVARSNRPDYYPWQLPPQEVYVQSQVKWERKEWIRYATDDERRKYYWDKKGPDILFDNGVLDNLLKQLE